MQRFRFAVAGFVFVMRSLSLKLADMFRLHRPDERLPAARIQDALRLLISCQFAILKRLMEVNLILQVQTAEVKPAAEPARHYRAADPAF